MLKVNDFFCGCGGMGLGFKQAGFETVGAWDFDKYAIQSYKHNIDEIVQQADITEMKGSDVPNADVWTFGFPCQDLSVAGKQAGMIKGQTRSGLFYEVMRLLDEVSDKPRIILAENVKGLKKYLPVLKEEYANAGYVMYVKLFNSKYWGVPQNRERYFVVGVRKDIDKGYFKFPKQDESFVPKLSSILESEVEEKFYISDDKAQKIIEQAMKRVELKGIHSCVTPDRVEKRQNGRRAKEDEQEMFTLTAQDLHGVICVGSNQKNAGVFKELSPTLTSAAGMGGGHTAMILDEIEPQLDGPQKIAGMFDSEKSKHQAGSVWNKNGTSPTLDTAQGGYRQPLVIEQPKILVEGNTNPSGSGMNGNVYNPDGIAPTLTTNKGEGYKITEGFRVRKLTPREYARLQGFPEEFKFVVSNTQLYKQFGNAVTVNVSKAIGQAIREHLS